MGYIDLHDTPFDETTIAKLEIFQDYAQAWIPTFVMQDRISEIHVFDFFAGTGFDKSGIAGSPIRILTKVQEQKGYLFQKQVNVVVHLNEFDNTKYIQLKKSCSDFLDKETGLSNKLTIKYYNEDFEKLFPTLLSDIRKYPSLVYLDQNGMKYLSDKYLLALEKTSQTDFLYFVSSSYFWRFGKRDEFKNHLDIDMALAKNQGYKKIHRSLVSELNKKLPIGTRLKLYPFSLKKGSNIHGIIFGASHPLAVDKFLSISWKRNSQNGDANFDIDDDEVKAQMNLFGEQKLTKIEGFKKEVENHLLNRHITNNYELLEFTYAAGHIPKHAADCLRELNKIGKVAYEGRSPLVTYDNVYKKKNKVEYLIKD